MIDSRFILICNCSFVDSKTAQSFDATELPYQPVVIIVDYSTLYLTSCSFFRNHISAVRAQASLSGEVIFSNIYWNCFHSCTKQHGGSNQ